MPLAVEHGRIEDSWSGLVQTLSTLILKTAWSF